MARTIGAYSKHELRLNKTIRELITPEQYEALVISLYNDALSAPLPKDRIAAAKIIIDRVEGPLTQIIEHKTNGVSINALFPAQDNNE